MSIFDEFSKKLNSNRQLVNVGQGIVRYFESDELSLRKVEDPLSDPLRAYLFRVTIPDIIVPGKAENAVDKVKRDLFDLGRTLAPLLPSAFTPDDALSYRVSRFGVPFLTIGTDTYYSNGTAEFYANTNEVGTASMSIIENGRGKPSITALMDWKSLIINGDGSYNEPAIYKRDILVELFNTQGESKLGFKLVGAFITSISELELSYDSNDLVKYEVSMAVDQVIILIEGKEYGKASPLSPRTMRPSDILAAGLTTVNNALNVGKLTKMF